MTLLEINRDPTPRQLRQFGGLCALAFPFVGWLWGASGVGIAVLAAVGLGLAGLGLVAPRALRPLFILLAMATAPIGMIVGELTLLLIFFAVFLPLGAAFRIFRRDALPRTFNANATTYWQPCGPAKDAASYFRQA